MAKKGLILKIFILLLVLISLSLLVYFLYPKSSKKLTEEKPVAIVAGEKISNKEYQAELAKSKDLITSLNSKLNPEKYVLDYLINKKIVEIEAKRRNITVSQDEIEKELQKLIKGYGSQEEFEKRIKTSGFTIDDLKEKVKTDLLKEKLAPFLLNFRDGRFIYVRYDTLTTEMWKEPVDPKEIEKRAEEKIEELAKEISQGTSFDEIDRRIIQERMKKNELYIDRSEFKQYDYEKFAADFDKTAADVVFSLKEREVSKPVKTPSGYFAIFIVDRIGKGPYKNWEDFFNDFRKREVKVFKNVFNFPFLKKIFSMFKVEEVEAGCNVCAGCKGAKIWGTVKDARRDTPIEGAEVTAHAQCEGHRCESLTDPKPGWCGPPSKTTYTDSSGYYEFEKYDGLDCFANCGWCAQAGQHKPWIVEVKKDGCGSKSQTVWITNNGTSRVDFKLDCGRPVIVDLTADPTQIKKGATSTLRWTSENADYCKWTMGLSGDAATSGSKVVSPRATTTYEITCYNSWDQNSDQATVGVEEPTSTPPSTSTEYCDILCCSPFGNPNVFDNYEQTCYYYHYQTCAACKYQGGYYHPENIVNVYFVIYIPWEVDKFVDPSDVTCNLDPLGPFYGETQIKVYKPYYQYYGKTVLKGTFSLLPSEYTVYTLTCSYKNFSVECPPIKIFVRPYPNVSLNVSPNPVCLGKEVTFTWSSDADYCKLNYLYYSFVSPSGSYTTQASAHPPYAEVKCDNVTLPGLPREAGPEVCETVESIGLDLCHYPYITLSAISPICRYISTTTITWNAYDAQYCEWNDIGQVPISGKRIVGPLSQDTTYTLTCHNPCGGDDCVNSKSITIGVKDCTQTCTWYQCEDIYCKQKIAQFPINQPCPISKCFSNDDCRKTCTWKKCEGMDCKQKTAQFPINQSCPISECSEDKECRKECLYNICTEDQQCTTTTSTIPLNEECPKSKCQNNDDCKGGGPGVPNWEWKEIPPFIISGVKRIGKFFHILYADLGSFLLKEGT